MVAGAHLGIQIRDLLPLRKTICNVIGQFPIVVIAFCNAGGVKRNTTSCPLFPAKGRGVPVRSATCQLPAANDSDEWIIPSDALPSRQRI